uniref:Uncharacterized protein n=1 Tax=Aureoumbra lagunensis TaxID=44058 RepID=A0A7S3JQP4_9STRA|mmetsp:Transcript_8463/g.12941  ORF Transcript_8463/g.12941 Transcript_8463/m.12941 type:complete len:592 (+) Transcript_8463:99-1874(+)
MSGLTSCAVYEKYCNRLFLNSNATFLCERLEAEEEKSASSLQWLASCYLRQGEAKRAYTVLEGRASTDELRYLLAIACLKLEKPHEAEIALLPDRNLRVLGPKAGTTALLSVVPQGAAGFYALGEACRQTHRREAAIGYMELSLQQDPLMWVAFEALCAMGAEPDANTYFKIKQGHPVIDVHAVCGPSYFDAAQVPTPATQRKPSEQVGSTRRLLDFGSTDASSTQKPPSKIPRTHFNQTREEKVQESSSDNNYQGVVSTLLLVLSKLGTARAALAKNDIKRALSSLHSLSPRHFETGWVQHALGRCHFEAADYEAAVDALRSMRRVEPHRIKGLELLSTALWHLKDEVELCYLSRAAVDFDPRAPESWCCAGNCLSLQKEHDAAVRCFQRAIALDPTFAYAFTLCGHEYAANDDLDHALAMYRHALRADDRHYNAWYGIGAIHFRQEKFDLAEYHFQRALSLNPQSSVLHCHIGMTHHANGNFDQALAYLRQAAELEPKNPQARFQTANVLISLDHCEEALAELSIVADYAPREASVHFLMGKVCKKLDRLSEAMMHFTYALDLQPKDNNLIKSAIDRLEEPDIDEEEKF